MVSSLSMSPLINIHFLSKSFGTQTLFKEISFTISGGDRIGLVGPNGAGKSTLLKILARLETPDSGDVSYKQGLTIGYASQSPEFPSKPLEQILLSVTPDLVRAHTLLGKAEFTDFTQDAHTLSGGWKKRLDIARILMCEPDLLLLDEPTNHLDLEGILWLEKFLSRQNTPYLIVSHDRTFIDNVSNKIIELNQCYSGGVFSSLGNLKTFVERREAFLQAQKKSERSLSSLVKEERAWLKKSPKARTTKSGARIRKAGELTDELATLQKRNKILKVSSLDFSPSEKETRKLLVAKNLSKSFAERTLFSGIDILLTPGTRLGLVGKNGTGKTTLLKVLAGQIAPDKGTVKYADEIHLAHFDQHREHLPSHLTLKEALSENGDYVSYRGEEIHVNGWAQRFLFPKEKLSLPLSSLSGGERARILIAKLMLKPADILFLDEPTNDLDIPTLEVIEESLKNFAGALVLISHDRSLMERLCTQILGLESGVPAQFFASYSQWETHAFKKESKSQVHKTPVCQEKKPSKKLSYQEQKELENMELKITHLEHEIVTIQEELNTSDSTQKSLELYRLLADKQATLDALFERWQTLLNK